MARLYPKLTDLFEFVTPVEYLRRQPMPVNPVEVRHALLQQGLLISANAK